MTIADSKNCHIPKRDTYDTNFEMIKTMKFHKWIKVLKKYVKQQLVNISQIFIFNTKHIL